MPQIKRNKHHAPQQARSRARVERMITAFGELLDEVGWEQAGTTAVAERADCAVGSVYQYFRDKEGIAKALRERYVDHVVAGVSDSLANEALVSEGGLTLVDCFVALHHAMERLHRTQPGAMHVPMLCDQISLELFEVFSAVAADMDQKVVLAHTVVAVGTSAAMVKIALSEPDMEAQILGLSQWMLQELGSGRP